MVDILTIAFNFVIQHWNCFRSTFLFHDWIEMNFRMKPWKVDQSRISKKMDQKSIWSNHLLIILTWKKRINGIVIISAKVWIWLKPWLSYSTFIPYLHGYKLNKRLRICCLEFTIKGGELVQNGIEFYWWVWIRKQRRCSINRVWQVIIISLHW